MALTERPWRAADWRAAEQRLRERITVLAEDREPFPLARVLAYAAHPVPLLRRGWTEAMIEVAVEQTGKLMDNGMEQDAAEWAAIKFTRAAFYVPERCGTCARFVAQFSACREFDRIVAASASALRCAAYTAIPHTEQS